MIMRHVRRRSWWTGRLWVTGASYRGVSVNDCILEAHRIVSAFTAYDLLT